MHGIRLETSRNPVDALEQSGCGVRVEPDAHRRRPAKEDRPEQSVRNQRQGCDRYRDADPPARGPVRQQRDQQDETGYGQSEKEQHEKEAGGSQQANPEPVQKGCLTSGSLEPAFLGR